LKTGDIPEAESVAEKKMNEKQNKTTSGPQREFHLHISQHLEMKMYKLKHKPYAMLCFRVLRK
jgi:hypothetical protein